jgi:hypothetical protein
VSEEEGAETVPERCQRVFLEPGERRHPEIEPLIALRLAPQEELHEQELHEARVRAGSVSHQIARDFRVLGAREQVREADGCAIAPHDGERKAAEIGAREEPEGEAFLPGTLLCEPGIRDRAQIGKERLHARRRHDLEGEAVALSTSMHGAQALPRPAVEGKGRQRHARFLAQLPQVETEIQIQRELLGPYLVEHGPAAVPVAQLAKAPREIPDHRGGPDRIAEGDPAPPLDSVHDEAASLAV